MAEKLEGWSAVVKTLSELKPRYLLVFWLPAAFLIFAPTNWLERFGIAGFVEQYRGWIGVIALVFFILWLVQLYATIHDAIKKKRENKDSKKDIEEYKKGVLKYLQNESLSQGELFFILYALEKKQQVIFANYTNQHAKALVFKGLLTEAASGSILDFPFMIPDFVFEYLQNNREKFLPQNANEQKQLSGMIESYDRFGWQRDQMF